MASMNRWVSGDIVRELSVGTRMLAIFTHLHSLCAAETTMERQAKAEKKVKQFMFDFVCYLVCGNFTI
jgi:hypothetical protein